jgi:serine/threonine protein kinase
MVFGTPEFMSPEQAQGKTLDARSDIYSLAVILYEVLTGKLPFEAKTPMEYIQHHVMSAPILLHERAPTAGFPPALSEVIQRALAKNPDDRYQTAADFAQALDPFVRGHNPASGPIPYPVPSSSAPLVVSQQMTPTPLQPSGTNTRLLVGVAAGALLVGAALTALAMQFLR